MDKRNRNRHTRLYRGSSTTRMQSDWVGADESLATKLGKRITPQDNGCWYWNGYHTPDGYAVHIKSYVHRLMYEIVKGDSLPTSMHVHHLCEVRRCVNPAHLLAVPASSHVKAHATARAEANRQRDGG